MKSVAAMLCDNLFFLEMLMPEVLHQSLLNEA